MRKINLHFKRQAFFLVVLLFLISGTEAFSQEKSNRINAQDVLARLDDALNFGNGLVKGNMVLIRRTGSSVSWKINLFRKESNLLYLFDKKGRGLENKLLSLDEGDKVYLFNTMSSQLFRKVEEEKYENFQNTGFSFVELSGQLYQANYDPIMKGKMDMGGKAYTRVALKPILTYSYKKLVLLVDQENLEPVRIDFHDKEGVLFKTLNIKYGQVKFKDSQGKSEKRMVNRLEMLTLNTGNIGVWEIHEVDETVKTDPALFTVENIGR